MIEHAINWFNRTCLVLTLILVTPLLALACVIATVYRLIFGEPEPEA